MKIEKDRQNLEWIVGGKTKRVADVLWNKEEIGKALVAAAEEIGTYYAPILEEDEKHDLLLVGILNGALPVLSALLGALPEFLPSDRFRYDLLGISSYGQGTSGGELRITKDLKDPVREDHVLIVEDIVDKGHTFGCLRAIFQSKHPSSIKIFTLIDKTARREADSTTIDFSGFTLKEDLFVVGFGLDWAGHGRTLPYIASLEDVN